MVRSFGKSRFKFGLETRVLNFQSNYRSSIQKFGNINGVDNVNWPPYRDSES